MMMTMTMRNGYADATTPKRAGVFSAISSCSRLKAAGWWHFQLQVWIDHLPAGCRLPRVTLAAPRPGRGDGICIRPPLTRGELALIWTRRAAIRGGWCLVTTVVACRDRPLEQRQRISTSR
ncbi:uncharacterized protein LOC120350572 [Nilaparvata lugens]|uniref:uncharacterized protein LOC120350572 n=1 Tax=Nilaparvata lugens TaxID=108931 RepID=UPI00193D5876|nr:uncharacterized protein LOC120350572 [Nilaparvata lugens]